MTYNHLNYNRVKKGFLTKEIRQASTVIQSISKTKEDWDEGRALLECILKKTKIALEDISNNKGKIIDIMGSDFKKYRSLVNNADIILEPDSDDDKTTFERYDSILSFLESKTQPSQQMGIVTENTNPTQLPVDAEERYELMKEEIEEFKASQQYKDEQTCEIEL